MGGLKDGSNLGCATNCAHNSRTAKAGSYDGGKPPSGPKAEPVKINGVPKIPSKGVK